LALTLCGHTQWETGKKKRKREAAEKKKKRRGTLRYVHSKGNRTAVKESWLFTISLEQPSRTCQVAVQIAMPARKTTRKRRKKSTKRVLTNIGEEKEKSNQSSAASL
jgi:hypothetical protein